MESFCKFWTFKPVELPKSIVCHFEIKNLSFDDFKAYIHSVDCIFLFVAVWI